MATSDTKTLDIAVKAGKPVLSKYLANAFTNEVAYLQGNIYSLPYEVRSCQWMSVHTVAGLVAYYADLDPTQFYKDCGFDAAALKQFKPEAE